MPDRKVEAPLATVVELLALAATLPGDTPRLDAELLLAQVLGRSRSWLYAWPERAVDPADAARYQALLLRRAAGEPVAYLLGQREFWSLPLAVDPSTLIPRPDTERLVEIALAQVDALLADRSETCAALLDLGTGTGAIALALASERPAWRLCAVDRDANAVALARANAAALGLVNVEVRQSDWFGALAPRQYHAIVSNPPYLAADDPHLAQGDLRFEPRTALVAADAGLADFTHIAQRAAEWLLPGGWLLFEHGAEQGAAVRRLLAAAGLVEVQGWHDLAGHERVSGGRRAMQPTHGEERVDG